MGSRCGRKRQVLDLSGLPSPVKVLVVVVAIPFAAMAAIFADIGYALHRVISRLANLS